MICGLRFAVPLRMIRWVSHEGARAFRGCATCRRDDWRRAVHQRRVRKVRWLLLPSKVPLARRITARLPPSPGRRSTKKFLRRHPFATIDRAFPSRPEAPENISALTSPRLLYWGDVLGVPAKREGRGKKFLRETTVNSCRLVALRSSPRLATRHPGCVSCGLFACRDSACAFVADHAQALAGNALRTW